MRVLIKSCARLGRGKAVSSNLIPISMCVCIHRTDVESESAMTSSGEEEDRHRRTESLFYRPVELIGGIEIEILGNVIILAWFTIARERVPDGIIHLN